MALIRKSTQFAIVSNIKPFTLLEIKATEMFIASSKWQFNYFTKANAETRVDWLE